MTVFWCALVFISACSVRHISGIKTDYCCWIVWFYPSIAGAQATMALNDWRVSVFLRGLRRGLLGLVVSWLSTYYSERAAKLCSRSAVFFLFVVQSVFFDTISQLFSIVFNIKIQHSRVQPLNNDRTRFFVPTVFGICVCRWQLNDWATECLYL